MIKKYIEKIGEKRNIEDMKKLGDMLSEIIYSTKESHPEIYHEYKMELYETETGEWNFTVHGYAGTFDSDTEPDETPAYSKSFDITIPENAEIYYEKAQKAKRRQSRA